MDHGRGTGSVLVIRDDVVVIYRKALISAGRMDDFRITPRAQVGPDMDSHGHLTGAGVFQNFQVPGKGVIIVIGLIIGHENFSFDLKVTARKYMRSDREFAALVFRHGG